jgi:hypothetical protein
MNLVDALGLDPISYQLGVFKGAGHTDEEIAQWATVWNTAHAVRPEPRYGDPATYATDDCDYPTEGPAGYGRAATTAASVSGTDKAASC